MANYYCKNCGKSFTSIKYLTLEKCIRNPLGTYKGYHEIYEGSEKDQYFLNTVANLLNQSKQ